MESTLQKPAIGAAMMPFKAKTIVYWTVTALFCLQMSFTAYAQLRRIPATVSHGASRAPGQSSRPRPTSVIAVIIRRQRTVVKVFRSEWVIEPGTFKDWAH